MVRKKDDIWKYVEESKGRFKCNFCERDFAGGASRIKSHLAGVKGRDIDLCTKVPKDVQGLNHTWQGVKGRDIDLCTKVPKDVQAEAYLASEGSSKKLKSASNLSNAEEIKTSTSRSNDLPQTTMLEMCKKKDQSAVDELLTQHFILNNIPFDVIQTSPFIHFVQGVAAYGSGYEVPSYLTLRTKLIPNFKIEVEAGTNKKEKQLESKMLDDDSVYMRMNTMMMEKSNTSKGQDLEPIDLDKLNELPEYVDCEQDKEDGTLGGVVENVNDDIINDASLIVRDHREELYKKHHPPSLSDEVWRLEKIDKDKAFHKRLRRENINTVKDFLTLLFRDPSRLQKILGRDMSTKMWEVTVEHARTCVIDDTRIFNVVGQVMELITEGQYVPIDKLSETEKADDHNLVISAFEHWEEVEPIEPIERLEEEHWEEVEPIERLEERRIEPIERLEEERELWEGLELFDEGPPTFEHWEEVEPIERLEERRIEPIERLEEREGLELFDEGPPTFEHWEEVEPIERLEERRIEPIERLEEERELWEGLELFDEGPPTFEHWEEVEPIERLEERRIEPIERLEEREELELFDEGPPTFEHWEY